MFRKSLIDQKNWTVVTGSIANHFETFTEALAQQSISGGHLMSRTFYETEYKHL